MTLRRILYAFKGGKGGCRGGGGHIFAILCFENVSFFGVKMSCFVSFFRYEESV